MTSFFDAKLTAAGAPAYPLTPAQAAIAGVPGLVWGFLPTKGTVQEIGGGRIAVNDLANPETQWRTAVDVTEPYGFTLSDSVFKDQRAIISSPATSTAETDLFERRRDVSGILHDPLITGKLSGVCLMQHNRTTFARAFSVGNSTAEFHWGPRTSNRLYFAGNNDSGVSTGTDQGVVYAQVSNVTIQTVPNCLFWSADYATGKLTVGVNTWRLGTRTFDLTEANVSSMWPQKIERIRLGGGISGGAANDATFAANLGFNFDIWSSAYEGLRYQILRDFGFSSSL